MAQPLSIERPDWVYLITTRTSDSKLWLINNKRLEALILGALARYQEIYGVIIYGFILMGNHYHLLAKFPRCNRALFMRDFNSAVARIIGREVQVHGRRSVWARRYSYQVLLRPEDIRHWFYYIALNAVSSGLVASAVSYPGYNSFFDGARGITRTYRWIEWSKYLMKVRYNPKLTPDDFALEYKLNLTRLPGTEGLSPKEYQSSLMLELERRQQVLVQKRLGSGRGFLGLIGLKAQAIGSKPKSTKQSSRHSHRPLILTLCAETKRKFLDTYFSIKDLFKKASCAFCLGDLSVVFPKGTYPPPRLKIA